MSNKRLPALTGSDEETLRRDRVDPFYGKRPSEIWQGQIERIEYKEPERCQHHFVNTKDGVECQRCRFGLLGKDLEARKGHVYFGSQKLF